MLSIDGRPLSRLFWDCFFFLVTSVYRLRSKDWRGIYINKIVLMFMEIGPPFTKLQSKRGLHTIQMLLEENYKKFVCKWNP